MVTTLRVRSPGVQPNSGHIPPVRLVTGADFAVGGVVALGYPVYVVTILGIGKLLAVPALLVPGFDRLKEWAYAGVMFDLTGAAASQSRSATRSGTST